MTLNEQIQLISEADFKYILKHGRRLNIVKEKFLGKKLESLIYFSYKLVKSEIPSNLASGNISEVIYQITKSKKKVSVQKAMPFILWVYDELKLIGQLEEHLASPPKAELVAAGVDSLNELGIFVTIDMLVKDWGIYTHKEVENMPYHFIFDKLMLMKKQNDIQDRLAEIQKEKSKRRNL